MNKAQQPDNARLRGKLGKRIHIQNRDAKGVSCKIKYVACKVESSANRLHDLSGQTTG